jgi:predicted ester cyclase
LGNAVVAILATLMSVHPLVAAFYTRIWNGGDLGAISAIISDDVSFRGSLGVELRGPEEFRRYVEGVRGALADYRCDILECVTEGNQAFAKMRFSGRHIGAFRGFSPTGKSVEWFGAALFTFSGSRIVSVWVLGDLSDLETRLRENTVPSASSTEQSR